MKKLILIAVITCFFIHQSFSQTARVVGPAEKKVTDSLCGCVATIDVSKISNKAEATEAYTGCVAKYIELLKDFADEKHVSFDDRVDMKKLGVDLAMNLLGRDCKGFKELALIMGRSNKSSDEMVSAALTGIFKRIENKGFNYFIIAEGGQEHSFLWLRQFNGSEKFMNGNVKYAGRKMKISYQELEVYLPQAKGYYKVKEITGLEIL